MKKIIFAIIPLFFLAIFSHCSSIQNPFSLFDDCVSFDPDTGDADLSDDCASLEDFLPEDQNDLAERTDIIYATNHDGAGNLVVLITDADGNPVEGLTIDDFTVRLSEDSGDTFAEVGITDVSTFGQLEENDPTETQFAFATVVDHSGSIFSDDLQLVQDGMETLYNDLPQIYTSAIVKFSENAELTTDFTTNKTTLINDITDDSFDRSSTALFDGLLLGVNETAIEDFPFKFVLLFTDGQENASDNDYATVRARFQEEGIPIVVIGVSFADIDILKTISDDSGGIFAYVSAFIELTGLFETVADIVRNLYRVQIPTLGVDVDRVRISVDVAGDTRTDTITVDL